MSEKKRGWKVVRVVADLLMSAMGDDGHRAIVSYEEGRETVPRKECGPLAVFKTYIDALDYTISISHYFMIDMEIHECEYVESVDISMWYHCTDSMKPNTMTSTFLRHCPNGTVFANSIMLGKRRKCVNVGVVEDG